MASVVKNPPAMRETQVQCWDREDTLEKRMATHSSILAWRILWTGEPGRLLLSNQHFHFHIRRELHKMRILELFRKFPYPRILH